MACIVGLDRHAHLHNAPAQNDDADGADAGKDEVGEIVYNGERVAACGKGRGGPHGQGQGGSAPIALSLFLRF